MLTTITSKAQVTVPAAVRRRLGLQPGDQLDFTVDPEGGLGVRVVKRAERTGSIMDLKGILKGRIPPMTLQEMESAIAEGAAEGNLPAGQRRRSA